MQVCPDVKGREVFQCGPTEMMDATASALQSLGVSSDHIHREEFSF